VAHAYLVKKSNYCWLGLTGELGKFVLLLLCSLLTPYDSEKGARSSVVG
jgi:hypothetical protein